MTTLREAAQQALEALERAECESCQTKDWRNEAAAELRRLHAENERLHQINQSHEMKLSVRGYEIQIADLEAQRDALLEALKFAEAALADIGDATREPGDDVAWCEARAAKALPQARAAIAKAEGEKT